ncbi:tetratricopeptide repeat protein 13-like isoform X1 [Biomphalaria glabrata]|nr:tetratricopeptide repeat protein 13-like isoform X1 [Biomphalaria glabrata]
MEMWLLSLYLQYSWVCFIFPDISVGHMCRVSNIQIDNEEGKQQFIELNLKKVDIDDISSCPGPGCSFHDEYNKFGEYHYSQWISSPPTFNLVFTPGELILECDTDASLALTPGLCATNEAEKGSCANDVCSLHDIEESVETIEDKQLLQLLTGDETLDHRVATAIVLLNLGNIDKAIEQFTSVIANDPTAAMAYFGRGVAYARKGLQSQGIAQKALNDFHKAIDLDTGQTRPDMYIHRAEMFLMMHRYQEAYNDATTALKLKPLPKIYFLRGVISLLMENFSLAEQDFRKNVQSPDESIRIMSHFHLGLALYYRGKVRNAVEVFKEVIKENPDHLGAVLSLAQGFKELSNVRGALARFNQSLLIQPNNTMVYNLRGNLLFTTGEHQAAILDYENCVSGDPYNANCQYMKAASKIILGQFYEGLKDTTKLMVSNIPVIKASPEHVKAHYLREYARYVHARLDGPISLIQPDMDFSPDYLDHWVKLKKFDIKNYKEQPGLQPDIRDVQSLTDVSPDLESLLCRAEALGRLSQVSVDGIVPDKRLNLAMGLASLHVAQYFEAKWKILKTKTGTQEKVVNSWKELFSIAVYYRRLANLEQPYLWVNMLPSYTSKEGHRTDIPFVRGSVHNMKVTPYNELAFKLAKTMLEHYSGDGAASYSGLKEDLAKATSCEDLLAVARKRQINPRGFLVSTQVPSVAGVREDNRLEGGILVLTEDQHQKIVFALNIVNMPDRMSSYHSEMDYLLMLLQDEMRKSGLSKASDVDVIISHILSIAYYFYNLIPLSKGSSAVAYSVLLGLIMSVGRQITGRIPNGRLLDMEAIFAGAPDAFVMVAKNWMQIKKISVPVSSLPKVSELLPTVRSVLEVLSFNSTTCLH